MAFCVKCGDEYIEKRLTKLGLKTCLPCGAKDALKEREGRFVIIDVNKSNPVVGTRAELAQANAKGPRTW